METKIKKPILCRPALRTLPNNINTECPRGDVNKSSVLEINDGESTENITKPLQKTTLLRKMSERYKTDSAPVLDDYLFKDDYQKEYLKLLICEEWRYILRRNFLDKSPFTVITRFAAVDWLFKIQQRFEIPENEFYLSIKIMDLSSKMCTDLTEERLLAITSLWMVHKFSNNSELISTSELTSILDEKFSKKDILAMERKILFAVNFKILLPEPSVFLEHYLKRTKVYENKNVISGSYFVCDCLTMFPKFSCVEASFIAAVALYTTLTVLKEDTCRLLCLMKNSYKEELLQSSSQDCLKKIKLIDKMENHKQAFLKYTNNNKLNIFEYLGECEELSNGIN